MDRLLDRLEDCRRSFEVAVVLGGAGAQVAERLAGGRAGVQQVVHLDTSQAMLERARSHAHASSSPGRPQPATRYVHWAPATEVLPLEQGADCEPRRGCRHAGASLARRLTLARVCSPRGSPCEA